MNKPEAVTGKARSTAHEAQRGALRALDSSWAEWLPRMGFAVRGALYATVGLLALLLALGKGEGKTTGLHGAISTIGAQPFGTFLLIVIVIGLAGYSLWGFVRAIFDPLQRGTDAKGIVQRFGYVISGLSYGALVPATISIMMGTGNVKQSDQADWTAGMLAHSWGPWVVAAIGLLSMGGGLGQFAQAFTAGFMRDLKRSEMSPRQHTLVETAGRVGYAARGVVFVMLGFFLVMAAWQRNPGEAKGLDGALQTLARQAYGPWLLGIVAAGLMAFGLYSMLCARWAQVVKD